MFPESVNIANLYYGHPGPFIQSLKGPFDPSRSMIPIQLGQLSCGCWVILDGNNRIGLIVKRSQDARLSDLPRKLFQAYGTGTWDDELVKWWNPYPKTIGTIIILTRDLNRLKRLKSSFRNHNLYLRLYGRIMTKIDARRHVCMIKST
jgi:hypothetical protein